MNESTQVTGFDFFFSFIFSSGRNGFTFVILDSVKRFTTQEEKELMIIDSAI